jgi:hypothetical protein
MAVVINGDTGISPVTASGTSASVDGMTVGRGGGESVTNTATGYVALASNSSGTQNSAFGNGALNTNSSGGNNTAIGYYAQVFNTTGGNNTSLGVQALYNNTTGSNATVVGYQAGYTTTVGLRQSFFGSQAGYYMTDENTSVGYRALYGASGSTGYYNVAVGRYALNVLTTGQSNVAIGDNALQAHTSGIENTAVGYQALNSNTTASYNTAVGRNSLVNCTTGTHNTVIGHNSGDTITTGTKNTILGRYNGNQGSVDIRTSSNNIVLSDGDGNPRMFCDGAGYWNINTGSTFGAMLGIRLITATTGDGIITRPDANVAYSAMVFKNSSGGNNGYISVSNSNTTSYVTTSDYRLKENVTPMTGALAKVAQLKPVTYDWKSGGSSQGFIAHELQAVVPDAVVGEKDALDKDGNPDYQGIDTSFLVATLTAALQELNAKFDAYVASHP